MLLSSFQQLMIILNITFNRSDFHIDRCDISVKLAQYCHGRILHIKNWSKCFVLFLFKFWESIFDFVSQNRNVVKAKIALFSVKHRIHRRLDILTDSFIWGVLFKYKTNYKTHVIKISSKHLLIDIFPDIGIYLFCQMH